jgi:hypothetical protein
LQNAEFHEKSILYDEIIESTTLFGHLAIFLAFENNEQKSTMYINGTIIFSYRTADVVAMIAADTHLPHAIPGQRPPVQERHHVFHLD